MSLIDADAFEKSVMFGDAEDMQDVIYALRNYPTTYDIDKVVKELNEWAFNANIDVGDGTVMNHNLIVRDTAIEIVKAGGNS